MRVILGLMPFRTRSLAAVLTEVGQKVDIVISGSKVTICRSGLESNHTALMEN